MTRKKPSENTLSENNKPVSESDPLVIPPLHREEDVKKHKDEANKLNETNEEFGGQEGEDPTRYGDWEKGGRCTDF